jgi:tetratricopeptide (TPR) repeat protein
MKKRILFLILFVITFLKLTSQNVSDFHSLKAAYNKERLNRDFKKAKIYNNLFLNNAKFKGDTTKIADGYYMLANTSQKNSTTIYLGSAIAITKNKVDFEQPAKSHLLKATILAVSSNYKEAFSEISKANLYDNLNENDYQQFEIKYLLSRLQSDVGDYDSSIETLQKLISYYEKEKLPSCENC